MRTAAVWTRTSKASLLALVVPTAAPGREAAATSARYLEEIIVTAQKWEQSANTVGMSITAATDEVLPEHSRTWASFRHSQSTQIQGA
jgi:hypothetical protein